MWHEARKSEKKVLGVMVDMQKRAERRRAYYDKLGGDSMQLLRLTGTPCKINLEPAISLAAENSTVMIALRCDADILIDRWDVRASMDVIPKYRSDPASLPEMDYLEQQRSYERYRVLVQNESKHVDEESYLQRIDMEELYPKSRATKKAEKKRLAAQRAAIGYKYDRGASAEQEAAAAELAKLIGKADDAEVEEVSAANTGDKSSDDEDVDRDRDPPVQIDQNNTQQKSELNRIGLGFGLSNFTSMVASEIMETKVEKEAAEMGNALSAISSRASKQNRSKRIEMRREKDQLLMTIPSYAQRASPTYDEYNPDGLDESDSSGSRSPSPVIEIITGFDSGTGTALKSSAMTSSGKPVGSSSSSRHHAEAASWSSSSTSQHRHRHSSPEHSRHHGHHHSRSRSPHRSSGGGGGGRHSQHRDGEGSRDRSRRSSSHSRDRSHRSRSRSRDRLKDGDDRRSYDKRSPQRGYSGSRYRSHSRSRSRSPDRGGRGDDSRAHRAGPEASRERSKTAIETPAKKLLQSKGADKAKLTPQEKLKLKMKLQLSRTQKSDRASEALKAEKQESQRQERMEDITEQTRKHREKERYRYHEDDDRHYGGRSPSPGEYDQRTGRRGGGGSSRYR